MKIKAGQTGNQQCHATFRLTEGIERGDATTGELQLCLSYTYHPEAGGSKNDCERITRLKTKLPAGFEWARANEARATVASSDESSFKIVRADLLPVLRKVLEAAGEQKLLEVLK